MKKRITIIGTDSTHCTAFSRLLNENNNRYDWKIEFAIRDLSSEIDLSRLRYQSIELELTDLGVIVTEELTDEVISLTDAFIITSVDASLHFNQFRKIVKLNKPVFIDKPIAYSKEDALDIFKLGQRYNNKIMSCSSLRFSESIQKAVKKIEKRDSDTFQINLYGPMPFENGIPGLFYYGIHTIEMLLTIFPKDFSICSVTETEETIFINACWQNILCEIRGNKFGNGDFHGEIITSTETIIFNQTQDKKPLYEYLLDVMLIFFDSRESPISEEETLSVVSMISKINAYGGWM